MDKQQIIEKSGRVLGSCRTDQQREVYAKYSALARRATGIDNFLGLPAFHHGYLEAIRHQK